MGLISREVSKNEQRLQYLGTVEYYTQLKAQNDNKNMMNKDKIHELNELMTEVKNILDQSTMWGQNYIIACSQKKILIQASETALDLFGISQELQDYCHDLSEEIYTLREQNQSLVDNTQILRDQNENIRFMMDQMEEKYKKDIREVNESQESLQNTYFDLSQTLDKQKDRNWELQQDGDLLRKQLSQLTDLYEQQHKKKRKYEQIQQDNQTLQTSLQQLNEYCCGLRDEIDLLREQNLKLKQQNSILQQNLAEFNYVMTHHQSKNQQFPEIVSEDKNYPIPESYNEDDYDKGYNKEKHFSDSPPQSIQEQSRCESIQPRLSLSRNNSQRSLKNTYQKYRRSTVYVMKDVQEEASEELSEFNHQISISSHQKLNKQQSTSRMPSICDISILETKRTSSSLKYKKKIKQLEKKLNESASKHHDEVTQLYGRLEMKDDQIQELKASYETQQKISSEFRKRMYEQKLKINEEKNLISMRHERLMEEYQILEEKLNKIMEGINYHMKNTMKNMIEEHFQEMQEYEEIINSRKKKLKNVSKSSVELYKPQEKISKDFSCQSNISVYSIATQSPFLRKDEAHDQSHESSQCQMAIQSQKDLQVNCQILNIEIRSDRNLSPDRLCRFPLSYHNSTQPSARTSINSINSFHEGFDNLKDQQILQSPNLNLIYEQSCEQSVANSGAKSIPFNNTFKLNELPSMKQQSIISENISASQTSNPINYLNTLQSQNQLVLDEQISEYQKHKYLSNTLTNGQMEVLRGYMKMKYDPTKQGEQQKVDQKYKWQKGKIYVCTATITQTDTPDKIIFWDSGIVSMTLDMGMSMKKLKKNIHDDFLFILGNCELIIEGNKLNTKRKGKKNYFEGNLPDMAWIINSVTTYQI